MTAQRMVRHIEQMPHIPVEVDEKENRLFEVYRIQQLRVQYQKQRVSGVGPTANSGTEMQRAAEVKMMVSLLLTATMAKGNGF